MLVMGYDYKKAKGEPPWRSDYLCKAAALTLVYFFCRQISPTPARLFNKITSSTDATNPFAPTHSITHTPCHSLKTSFLPSSRRLRRPRTLLSGSPNGYVSLSSLFSNGPALWSRFFFGMAATTRTSDINNQLTFSRLCFTADMRMIQLKFGPGP